MDERLERLRERQEALTQSVELLTQDIRELTNSQKALVKAHEDLARAQAASEQRMAQAMDLYTRLGNIVIAHEDRISKLEERNGPEL